MTSIGIVNDGLGNVGSVRSALEFYGYRVSLIERGDQLRDVDILMLAGVGNFHAAVAKLRSEGFWELLDEAVRDDRHPVIGLCLGMQLFADCGHEGGKERGFGWIQGDVVKIGTNGVKVPHIGWDRIEYRDDAVFRGMRYHYFYFMHSYHFVPVRPEVVIAWTRYGDTSLVAAVKSNNVIGFQFHPEKSQSDGMRILRNVVEGFI